MMLAGVRFLTISKVYLLIFFSFFWNLRIYIAFPQTFRAPNPFNGQ